MDYSSVFKQAGKYAGLPGFSPGISLGENLTTPLGQQASGTHAQQGEGGRFGNTCHAEPEVGDLDRWKAVPALG